jgi:hypothetical protein
MKLCPSCFVIGVYKGDDLKDDLVLKAVEAEVLKLRPPKEFSYPNSHMQRTSPTDEGMAAGQERQLYVEFSYWIADGKERCYLCGTLSHMGYVSCPRCTLMGTKDYSASQKKRMTAEQLLRPSKNCPYFTSVNGPPRLDSEWDSYLQKSGQGEVSIIIY